jgi:hypothetical protein
MKVEVREDYPRLDCWFYRTARKLYKRKNEGME